MIIKKDFTRSHIRVEFSPEDEENEFYFFYDDSLLFYLEGGESVLGEWR